MRWNYIIYGGAPIVDKMKDGTLGFEEGRRIWLDPIR